MGSTIAVLVTALLALRSYFDMAHESSASPQLVQLTLPTSGLTVWLSDGFGEVLWRGDLKRWTKYFSSKAGYVQGDAAVRHADGSYSFHGRSDEVINVGGHRIGTAEIESALLADTERAEGSPLRNCVVVGMDDRVLGTAPCAFLVLQPGASLRPADEGRLRALVQTKLSSVAVPARFICVEALPETHSGKYMRALLRAMATDAPLPNTGALRNPECIEPLRRAISAAVGGGAVASQRPPPAPPQALRTRGGSDGLRPGPLVSPDHTWESASKPGQGHPRTLPHLCPGGELGVGVCCGRRRARPPGPLPGHLARAHGRRGVPKAADARELPGPAQPGKCVCVCVCVCVCCCCCMCVVCVEARLELRDKRRVFAPSQVGFFKPACIPKAVHRLM